MRDKWLYIGCILVTYCLRWDSVMSRAFVKVRYRSVLRVPRGLYQQTLGFAYYDLLWNENKIYHLNYTYNSLVSRIMVPTNMKGSRIRKQKTRKVWKWYCGACSEEQDSIIMKMGQVPVANTLSEWLFLPCFIGIPLIQHCPTWQWQTWLLWNHSTSCIWNLALL